MLGVDKVQDACKRVLDDWAGQRPIKTCQAKELGLYEEGIKNSEQNFSFPYNLREVVSKHTYFEGRKTWPQIPSLATNSVG